MLFVIGLLLLIASFCVGVIWGHPDPLLFNQWDGIARVGIIFGVLLMATSLCIFIWGLLP